MDEMWVSICDSITSAIALAKIDAKEINGISTVGHGKGVYLIDREGRPVRNGILSTDSRANTFVKKFDPIRERVAQISKQPIMPIQAPILMNWIKENEPDNYQKIAGFLSAKDYVRFKLTDTINLEYTDTSGNNMMNLETLEYDRELFELFEISEMFDLLPKLVEYNEVVGTTTKEVERLTGIAQGTPVVGGMFDIDASALATQVLDDQYISVTAGTWSINEYLSMTTNQEDPRILNSVFADKNYYLIESSSATSAGNLDVVLDQLFKDDLMAKHAKENDSVYDVVNRYLTQTNANSTELIFLPFLYGSNVNSKARAVFVGLQSNSTPLEIVRAVCEGVIFSHKYHIDALLNTKRSETKGIRLAGGVVNSPVWVQMFADVLGHPIETVDGKELGALGATMGLAYGLGIYNSIEEAVNHMSRFKQKVVPDESEHAVYQKKYEVYLDVLKALDPIWEKHY